MMAHMTDGVGERLKALRRAAGWSQEALAQLVNEQFGTTWQQTTVQKIEAETRPLTLADVEHLAVVFGMKIEDMIYGQDDWDSTAEVPIEDPLHELRRRALDTRIKHFHFEEQDLLVRLAEVRAGRRRAEAELDYHFNRADDDPAKDRY